MSAAKHHAKRGEAKGAARFALDYKHEKGVTKKAASEYVAKKFNLEPESVRKAMTRLESGKEGEHFRVLDEMQELVLVQIILSYALESTPISTEMFFKLVDSMTSRETYNRRDFIRHFMERHQRQIRIGPTKPISTARVDKAVEDKVEAFADHLEKVSTEWNFTSRAVVNADETSLRIKDGKHLLIGYTKQEANVVSKRNKLKGSALCFGLATGELYLVLILLKMENVCKSKLGLYGHPCLADIDINALPIRWHRGFPKIYLMGNKSGCWNQEDIKVAMNHFLLEWSNDHQGMKGILFWDNMSAHNAAGIAPTLLNAGIYLMPLPPNTTHWLQPLDVGTFGELKKKVRTEKTEIDLANFLEGAPMDQSQWYGFIAGLLQQSASREGRISLRNAFESRGLWPVSKEKMMEVFNERVNGVLPTHEVDGFQNVQCSLTNTCREVMNTIRQERHKKAKLDRHREKLDLRAPVEGTRTEVEGRVVKPKPKESKKRKRSNEDAGSEKQERETPRQALKRILDPYHYCQNEACVGGSGNKPLRYKRPKSGVSKWKMCSHCQQYSLCGGCITEFGYLLDEHENKCDFPMEEYTRLQALIAGDSTTDTSTPPPSNKKNKT